MSFNIYPNQLYIIFVHNFLKLVTLNTYRPNVSGSINLCLMIHDHFTSPFVFRQRILMRNLEMSRTLFDANSLHEPIFFISYSTSSTHSSVARIN